MKSHVTLFILLGLAQVVEGIYIAKEQPTPGSFHLLYIMALLWCTGMWLETDNKKYGVDWMFDMGLFLYLAWPLVLPVYLFRTRGIRALRCIAAAVGVFVLATTVGYLLGTVL